MTYRFAFLIAGLVLSSAGHALQDPTRPPGSSSAPVAIQEARSHALDSVVIGPRRRVAVIDGVPRREGEKFDGTHLRRIYSDRVELVEQGQVHVVHLDTLPDIRGPQ